MGVVSSWIVGWEVKVDGMIGAIVVVPEEAGQGSPWQGSPCIRMPRQEGAVPFRKCWRGVGQYSLDWRWGVGGRGSTRDGSRRGPFFFVGSPSRRWEPPERQRKTRRRGGGVVGMGMGMGAAAAGRRRRCRGCPPHTIRPPLGSGGGGPWNPVRWRLARVGFAGYNGTRTIRKHGNGEAEEGSGGGVILLEACEVHDCHGWGGRHYMG